MTLWIEVMCGVYEANDVRTGAKTMCGVLRTRVKSVVVCPGRLVVVPHVRRGPRGGLLERQVFRELSHRRAFARTLAEYWEQYVWCMASDWLIEWPNTLER